MKFTDKTEDDRIKIDAIFDKCRSIYHKYGGYDYNDEMAYHIEGFSYSMGELTSQHNRCGDLLVGNVT